MLVTPLKTAITSTPAADWRAKASSDNLKLIHASASYDNSLVVSLTLCRGHTGILSNAFNPSAIVPDSHDLQACRRDTLIGLAVG